MTQDGEETAKEVELISRNLRPGVLEHLGLVEVLRATSTEFEKRTGVTLNLECSQLSGRLPAEIELTLYRILQEALKNVEKHARARHVTVHLTKSGNIVQLTSREMEVLQLTAEGKANKETAAELGISIKTVEKHRGHLMEKLDIHDAAGLTRYAIGAGIIESSVHLTII